MKQIIENYTFDKDAGTVELDDFTTVSLDRILLITDVTENRILYNFADDTLGATVATNVITLVGASMSGLSDSDKLQVFYDVLPTDPAFEPEQVTLGEPIAGEDFDTNRMMVEQRFIPLTIEEAGTHQLDALPGFLHRIIATGGPSGTIEVWDSLTASGTPIAKYDGVNFFNHPYNCITAVGLTVVTSADTKLTFMVRA